MSLTKSFATSSTSSTNPNNHARQDGRCMQMKAGIRTVCRHVLIARRQKGAALRQSL